MNRTRSFHPATLFSAFVFALYGAALTWGGIVLLRQSGSVYYIVAGVITLLVALLLLLRQRSAVTIYALLLIGTTGWAFWEVGLDWWQLLTRLDLWFALGLWLLLPWPRRGLNRERYYASARGTGGGVLFLALLVMAAVGVAGALRPERDIPGELPMADVTGPQGDRAMRPDGDWTDYGGSPYGQRYSPLTQITPDNATRSFSYLSRNNGR